MAGNLRLGIIGFDTSHAVAFTKLLNHPEVPFHVPGARVVAGCPTFSPDVEASAGRVEGFTAQLRDMGIEVLDSIEALVEQVDAVLLLSVDGRRHLEEAAPVIHAGKPLFVDKPLAHNYRDAEKLARLAVDYRCPLFSASSLRFDANIHALHAAPPGEITACEAFTPATLEPTNPGLFWYGVHGVEMLYSFMGSGCESVHCHSTATNDIAVGTWPGGRIGTVRGLRNGSHPYGVTVYGPQGVQQTQRSQEVPVYAGLLSEIVRFFQGGPAPVALEETLETMAFMQAALISQESGRAVWLEEVR